MLPVFRAALFCCALQPVLAHDGDLLAHAAGDSRRPLSEAPFPVATGSGALAYQTVPGWGSVPDKLKIGPTHGGVVIDKAGHIYVSSDGNEGLFVFKADGTLVKKIAPEFSGIHGMMIREENGSEFIYAAHLRAKQVVKLDLDGNAVLKLGVPAESGAYPNGQGYSPTGVTVGPDGAIFVADGYGKSLIHKYDASGKYLKTFGGKGNGDGQFQTCHGIALDTRGEKPLLLVCDRENRRLVHMDLDGNFVAVITKDLRRPCAVSILGDHVAIAELEARVTILDRTNQPVAHLGDNPDKSQWAKFPSPPTEWKDGIFTAPHGLSYDKDGNLYVQDWNQTGRITKLTKQAAH